MIHLSNMIFASGLETALESLTGWPLAVVICVGAVCLASVLIDRWPWQKD
jgi:hypothetical protein